MAMFKQMKTFVFGHVNLKDCWLWHELPLNIHITQSHPRSEGKNMNKSYTLEHTRVPFRGFIHK